MPPEALQAAPIFVSTTTTTTMMTPPCHFHADAPTPSHNVLRPTALAPCFQEEDVTPTKQRRGKHCDKDKKSKIIVRTSESKTPRGMLPVRAPGNAKIHRILQNFECDTFYLPLLNRNSKLSFPKGSFEVDFVRALHGKELMKAYLQVIGRKVFDALQELDQYDYIHLRQADTSSMRVNISRDYLERNPHLVTGAMMDSQAGGHYGNGV